MALIRILFLILAAIFSWSYFLTGAFEFTAKVQNLSKGNLDRPAWTSDVQNYVSTAFGNLKEHPDAMVVYGVLLLVFGWILWKTIRYGVIGVAIMLVVMLTYPTVASMVEPVPKTEINNSGYREIVGTDQQMYAGEEYPLIGVSLIWTIFFLGGAWVATRPGRTYV